SIESAVRGLFGFAKKGSMMMALPPGVRTSKQLWPYQVNVVSRSRDMRWTPPGSMLQRGYTRPRVRHADRPESRLRQLDGPDRPGARDVRGDRPAPPPDDGHTGLPSVRRDVRPRLRGPRLGLGRGAACGAGRLTGRRPSGVGRAASPGARR